MARPRRTWPLVLAALSAGAGPLRGQGVSGAAIQGRVTGPRGAPLLGAIVEAADPANGARWRAVTGGTGVFFLDNLPVGGPYEVTVRAIGFPPARRARITLRRGQRLDADFVLQPVAVELAPISVTVAAPSSLDPARGGAAQVIGESTFARLPVAGRSEERRVGK